MGSNEAQAIALSLENIEMPRPLTHDLLTDILDQFDVTVSRIFISHLLKGTFFASIELISELKKFKIDSRPSDAIAIALRTESPIFVRDSLFETGDMEQVIHESEFTPVSKENEDVPLTSIDDKISGMKKALKQAIDLENYEVAAVLRDKLRREEENH